MANREIKFRAWYKPISHMVTTDKVESINFDTKTIGVYMDFENRGFHKLRLSDFDLMQYTGLKDRNGKEIYEGDILRYVDGHNCSSESGFDYYEFSNIGAIEWDENEARFTVTNRDMVDLETFFEDIGDTEVIGNIYDNPNLLKEANQNETT